VGAKGGVRERVDFESVATERLEAEVQTTAALIAAATCEWLLMIGELDRREAWLSWECRSMAHWLSWKCALSLRTGREHVRVARELERLPLTTAAFAAGQLSYSKVRALTRIVSAPELEADLVAVALAATASQLDSIAAGCDRVRRLNDPQQERRNHDERRWSVALDDDGTGTITMRGPSDLIAEVMAAVDAEVQREPANDGEPLEARRFDAAVAVARRDRAPDPEGPPPTTIVIRAEAVAPSEPDLTRLRAHGLPISRAAYERFRCDAAVAVERLLDDGSIERHRTTEAIPRAIRRAVRNRDLGTCRWPGCNAHASLHIHHIVWRSQAGRHELWNLVSLCHYHHRSVHHRGWTVAGDANGPLMFTDPRGRIADERTDRHRAVKSGALAAVHAERGFNSGTIATALGDRLNREWAVGVVCHNDEIHHRRN